MTCDDCFDVWHASVTYTEVVLVPNLRQFVVSGFKMFASESDEFFPDICFDVLAERRIKPNYISRLFFRVFFDISV